MILILYDQSNNIIFTLIWLINLNNICKFKNKLVYLYMENQIGRLLVNIHNSEITAVITGECNNGSLKVVLTDLSAPSSKLRKPKQSTIEKGYRSDWK